MRLSHNKCMLNQFEFLIEGPLLPSISEYRVSDRLIFKEASHIDPRFTPEGKSANYALGFVGMEENRFKEALRYIGFFLLLYCLQTGDPIIQYHRVAVPIESLEALGSIDTIGLYERVNPRPPMRPLIANIKPLEKVKQRFCELESDVDLIMQSHIGLALNYYYFACEPFNRGRFDHAIIHLAIAVEALVTTESHNVTDAISRRLARLVTTKKLENENMVKDLKKFYQLRSDIVHGRRRHAKKSEVRQAASYVNQAIERSFPFRALDKKEFVHRLDLAKLE